MVSDIGVFNLYLVSLTYILQVSWIPPTKYNEIHRFPSGSVCFLGGFRLHSLLSWASLGLWGGLLCIPFQLIALVLALHLSTKHKNQRDLPAGPSRSRAGRRWVGQQGGRVGDSFGGCFAVNTAGCSMALKWKPVRPARKTGARSTNELHFLIYWSRTFQYFPVFFLFLISTWEATRFPSVNGLHLPLSTNGPAATRAAPPGACRATGSAGGTRRVRRSKRRGFRWSVLYPLPPACAKKLLVASCCDGYICS